MGRRRAAATADDIRSGIKWWEEHDGLPKGEDIGFTKQPFTSPELQREMILPYHKRLGDFIHSDGIPWIMHS
mgnify:CR=1 FL=1